MKRYCPGVVARRGLLKLGERSAFCSDESVVDGVESLTGAVDARVLMSPRYDPVTSDRISPAEPTSVHVSLTSPAAGAFTPMPPSTPLRKRDPASISHQRPAE